jgi:hypothetical protein
MSSRADYVQALKNERAMVASRPTPSADRLAGIDAELARFADEPEVEVQEAAVPGPISSSRKKVRSAPAAETPAEPVEDAPADAVEGDVDGEPTPS